LNILFSVGKLFCKGAGSVGRGQLGRQPNMIGYNFFMPDPIWVDLISFESSW